MIFFSWYPVVLHRICILIYDGYDNKTIFQYWVSLPLSNKTNSLELSVTLIVEWGSNFVFVNELCFTAFPKMLDEDTKYRTVETVFSLC